MNKDKILVIAACALLTAQTAVADGTRADDHAPIGVMGDHFHGKENGCSPIAS